MSPRGSYQRNPTPKGKNSTRWESKSGDGGGRRSNPKDELRGCLRKVLGARSELLATVWLWDQGFEVYRNLSDRGVVDMIATREEDILKIDVTTGSWRGGGACGSLRPQWKTLKYSGVRVIVVLPDDTVHWADDLKR